MRSICRMCQAVGIWLEEWCWACQDAVGRTASQRAQARRGEKIGPNVRKWSAELFETIEELKQSIEEIDTLEAAWDAKDTDHDS